VPARSAKPSEFCGAHSQAKKQHGQNNMWPAAAGVLVCISQNIRPLVPVEAEKGCGGVLILLFSDPWWHPGQSSHLKKTQLLGR